jgi:hypothetical protein
MGDVTPVMLADSYGGAQPVAHKGFQFGNAACQVF